MRMLRGTLLYGSDHSLQYRTTSSHPSKFLFSQIKGKGGETAPGEP